MNSPFRSSPPEEARPYIPTWGRQQPVGKASGYDIFSDEENPSYREMAQMFSPQQPSEKDRPRGSNKILMRFLGIVGLAATALGLFVGYVVTQPGEETVVAGRDSGIGQGVTKAIDAVQATFAGSLTPPPAGKQGSSINEPPKEIATPSAPAAAPVVSKANPVEKAAVEPVPAAAPVETAAPKAEASPPAAAPAQVAALTSEPEISLPAAPAIPELTAGELATLMARGRRFVETGDFASARPVYRRAAEAGYAEAAIALGETYDPHALSEKGAVGIAPNVDEAKRWYTRARDMGSLEAPTRLERLK